MPSILLINENKIVSRLLQLSSQKQGYILEELNNLGASGTSYDVIFIDSDLYNDELMQNIKSKFTYNYLGFIGAKKDTLPDGFDLTIEKPFLPTDFVSLIKEQVIDADVQPSVKELVDTDESLSDELDLDDETELLLSEDEIELDDIDDIDSSDDLLDLDNLEDLDDDVDLSLDSSTVMTTGIVEKMSNNSGHEELADMVSEIDDMDLEDEINIEDEIVSETTEKLLVDDSFEDDLEELEPVEEDLLVDDNFEEKEEEQNDSLVTAGIAMATAGVAAVASEIIPEDKKEDIVTDDLDDLDELDMKDALGEEVVDLDTPVGEIISEELDELQTTETTVESNDVESWIRDAVAKAITPQMIKEALDGMDVNVTLSFNTKKED